MKTKFLSFFSFLLLTITTPLFAQKNRSTQPTLLITNVQLIDGTGKPAYKASVRIQGKKIMELGQLKAGTNEMIIDGKGLVLAPGFIDSHSHHFGDLEDHPEAIPTNSQGITTIIIGQDGGSYAMDTIAKMFKERSMAVNVGTYTGQGTIREEVMGENDVYREASQAEIDKMKIILQKELEKGSLGLSTGLEYEQAFFSSKDEVIQLAKVTAAAKARYMSHIRSEDIKFQEAIDEII